MFDTTAAPSPPLTGVRVVDAAPMIATLLGYFGADPHFEERGSITSVELVELPRCPRDELARLVAEGVVGPAAR